MSALMIQKINLLIARTVNDKTKQTTAYRGGQIDIVIKLAKITGFPLETLNRHITKKEQESNCAVDNKYGMGKCSKHKKE